MIQKSAKINRAPVLGRGKGSAHGIPFRSGASVPTACCIVMVMAALDGLFPEHLIPGPRSQAAVSADTAFW